MIFQLKYNIRVIFFFPCWGKFYFTQLPEHKRILSVKPTPENVAVVELQRPLQSLFVASQVIRNRV